MSNCTIHIYIYIYAVCHLYINKAVKKRKGTTILIKLNDPKGPSTTASAACMNETPGDFLIYVSVP